MSNKPKLWFDRDRVDVIQLEINNISQKWNNNITLVMIHAQI